MANDIEHAVEILKQEEVWMSIWRLSDKSPAMQEAVDRVLVIHALENTHE